MIKNKENLHTNILDDEPDDDFEVKNTGLDLNLIRNKIPGYTSEKLCEMIVCDRYFGCYKEIAIMCMEELSNRRTNGDAFNFEDYIENAYKELPQLDFSVPDLGDVLRQAIGRKLNQK